MKTKKPNFNCIRILSDPETIADVDGGVFVVFASPVNLDVDDPRKLHWQLEQLVQGTPQIFPLDTARLVVCGVGKLEHYNYNPIATEIARTEGAIEPLETITGDVVILPPDEGEIGEKVRNKVEELCALMAQIVASEGRFFEVDPEKIN